jgi:putative Mg2+ transporter-C (MgtC) family protein
MSEVYSFIDWALRAVLAEGDAVLRMLLAAALGGWIGLEREASGKPAGFRTNLIICLGSALVTEISIALSRTVEPGMGLIADPGRIAAQVVSGIGFLGAGTIIQSRGSVTGLTTAATLWVVAMIGIGVGAQAYVLSVVAAVLVILALRILGRVDDYLLPSVQRTSLEVIMEPAADAVSRLTEHLRERGVRVARLDVSRQEKRTVISIRTWTHSRNAGDLADQVLACPGVSDVTVR